MTCIIMTGIVIHFLPCGQVIFRSFAEERVFYSLPFELKLHTLWIHNDIERQSQRGAGRDRQRVRERDRESVWCCWLYSVENEKERKKKKIFLTS